MKETNLQIALLEKQILHCYMDNPNLIDEDMDYFISPQALELFYDLISLKNDGKKLIPEHILLLDNDFINSDVLMSVQETDYQVESLDDYKDKLSKKFIIHDFKTNTLNELNEDRSDESTIEKISEEFEKAKNQIKNKRKDTEPFSFGNLLDEYKEEIEKRAKGVKTSTGDYNLDRLIPNIQAGIGLIVGMSGSMKSTYIIKLLRNRITKRLPTCAINTELTHATYMDTLVSTMIDESYNDLTGDTNDEDSIDWNSIFRKLDDLQKHYDKQKKTFNFFPKNEVTIKEVEEFCVKSRKEFGLEDDETLFCTIDLLLMIADMNDPKLSRADAITQGMNKLNVIALKHNIFFLATIQSRRLANKVQINDISDLNKFKISTEMLKESGSLEERSRVILALHNPKYLVNKNPCSQLIRDLVDPILELTVIKNSWKSNLGETIYYYIDNEHKDLINYEPEDGEIPNSQSIEKDKEKTNLDDDEEMKLLKSVLSED